MSIGDRLRKLFLKAPQAAAPTLRDSSAFQGPFLGPGTPIPAVFRGSAPRYFDYQSGQNLNLQPRTEYPIIPSFRHLWTIYLSSPVIRVSLSFRTQQINALSWHFHPRQGGGAVSSRAVGKMTELLSRPDPQNGMNFEQWLRSILQEVAVTDALTIYPVRSKLGSVIAFTQIDGQTIKPLIDFERGGIPLPPAPAYTQWIKGIPFAEFNSEDIIYRPFRPRVWCTYGESRVENIMSTAILYALHERWNLEWFTSGNIPDVAGLVDEKAAGMIDNKKLLEWQGLMDQMAGINPERRRIHLMPPFVKDLKALKEYTFSKDLPDWLVRLSSIAFWVPPHVFVSETNRSTAKEMNSILYDAPLRQDLMSLKRLFDELAAIAGYPELEFDWKMERDFSLEGVQGISLLVEKGVMPLEFAQKLLGISTDDPAGMGHEDGSSGDEGQTEETLAGQDEEQGKPRLELVPGAEKGRYSDRRDFKGPGATRRAAHINSLVPALRKGLLKHEQKVLKEAVARARSLGKAVKGHK